MNENLPMIATELNKLLEHYALSEILRVLENICYSKADANKDDRIFYAYAQKGLILSNAKRKVINTEAQYK